MIPTLRDWSLNLETCRAKCPTCGSANVEVTFDMQGPTRCVCQDCDNEARATVTFKQMMETK